MCVCVCVHARVCTVLSGDVMTRGSPSDNCYGIQAFYEVIEPACF